MRSWVSAVLILVACSSPDRPPPHPPAPLPAPKLTAPRPTQRPPACKKITARCDHAVDDDAVFKLVRHRCWACHATDGIAGHDFPDLSALRAAPVDEMIGTCQMPPDGAPLAEPDRQLLVEWATCKQ